MTPTDRANSWTDRESLIDRFEEAWLQGLRPAIDDFLPADEGRQAVLVELVHADLERRLERGETARVEGYLERYPELSGDPAIVADLLRAEFELRRDRQPTLSLAGAGLRFPAPAEPGEATPLPPAGRAGLRLLPGRRQRLPVVAGYEVLEEIGRGGMGVVYRARQTALARTVALKMILAGEHADDRARTRFRTEAVSVARLRHPNIVQVYDVGEEDGQPFLALEYLDGGSLAQKLDGAPRAAPQAAELVQILARAAHHAHEAGIVHRDLKPANILLTTDGTPKIADFGLARTTDADHGQTSTGAVVGTPSYMAPEQAGGRVPVGPAADLYALGAILYELLTGRPPFRGATAVETLDQLRSREPVAPSRLQPRLPRDLETICLKCLAKEPTQRYVSAAALADDLQRFRNGEPIRARPTPTWERLVKAARRRPTVAALGVLLVLVAGVGMAGVAWQWNQTRNNLESAEANLYSYRIGLADREWHDNHIDRAAQLLADCPPERRGWEWHYLQRLNHRALASLTAEGAAGVAWSPDPGGRYFAANLMGAQEVGIWDAATNQLLHKLPNAGPALAWSPDGKRLASASYQLGTHNELVVGQSSEIRIYDAASAAVVQKLPGHNGPVLALAFSPDGGRLATGSMDRTVKVWDLAAGKELTSFGGHAGWVEGVAFRPDGRRIVSTAADDTIKLWDAATGVEQLALGGARNISSRARMGKEVLKPVRGTVQDAGRAALAGAGDEAVVPWQVQLHEPHPVAFAPDGLRIAAGRGNAVKIWDATSGVEVQTLRGHTDLVRALTFDRAGARLVTGGHDQAVKVWNLTTGEEQATFRGHGAPVGGVAFRPDGGRILSAGWDQKLQIWDAASGGEALVLRGHEGIVHALAASPDGRWVASAGGDRTVKLWDVVSGQLRFHLTGHTASVNSLAFDAAGDVLASAGADGSAKLWDVATGTLVRTIAADEPLLHAAFLPEGRLLTVGRDGAAVVWNATTGQRIRTLPARISQVRAVAVDSSGTQLARASAEFDVRLQNVATGSESADLGVSSSPITALAFGPGRLAEGTLDGTVLVWDRTTRRPEMVLHGHTNAVTALAFSPDGKRLATGGIDRGVKIWDAATRQELLTLHGVRTEILALTFTADGRRLVMAGADGAVAVWDGSPLPE